MIPPKKAAAGSFASGLFLTVVFLLLATHAGTFASSSQNVLPASAPTPPMGWNSWDAYGETVSEKDIRESARFIATNLKSHGWQYVVVDSGWYVKNHTAGTNSAEAEFSLDSYGRLTPAANTIPSAVRGAGFKPLADYVHSLGLKFGIHILRGIPKEAVKRNLPIEGTDFHASDAADTNDSCPWNPFNYGLNPLSPAAAGYYDSIARLYRDWGVDYLKVDCIASHPYKPEEIRLISEAIKKTGRPVVLSLSPGPAPLDKAEDLSRYAEMWRISDDVWDVWHSEKDFPQGPRNQFDRAARWAPFAKPGHWPDADMLPLGSLRPRAGWGEPRETRLTKDEQRTLLTLWCIFRSPLIYGGNVLALKDDPWTLGLLTNDEVIGVDQRGERSRAVVNEPSLAIWTSQAGGEDLYLAVFNLDDQPQTIERSWDSVGLGKGGYRVRDLWARRDLGGADSLSVSLPPHGSVLYRIAPR